MREIVTVYRRRRPRGRPALLASNLSYPDTCPASFQPTSLQQPRVQQFRQQFQQ